VVTGASGPAGAGGERDKGQAEQVLLDTAITDWPQVFTPHRLWIMDRNFPGVPRIQRMLATGTHVLIRVKDGITLHRIGDFLPDGSYLATIRGGGLTLTVRVIEYWVSIAAQDTRKLFCLITDLHEHLAYPAQALADAYHQQWIGSQNLPQGSQIHHHRRRTLHRRDAALNLPQAGSPGTRSLSHRHRTDPSHRPRRRRARHASQDRTPRRPAGTPPGNLLHRRPPRPDHHHPHRHRHRQPAHRGHHHQPRHHPGPAGPGRRVVVDRNRHRDHKTKARLGLPHHRATPSHPHRTRPHQHLQLAA
jgi:hypothetical protein